MIDKHFIEDLRSYKHVHRGPVKGVQGARARVQGARARVQGARARVQGARARRIKNSFAPQKKQI